MQKEETLIIKEVPQQDISSKKILSITEAAQLKQVTRQAIYVAIKQNKLKAQKEDMHWKIRLEDLIEYQKGLYSREKSKFEGELIFDPKKGYYSVNQTAKMLNVPVQKIYYAARVGQLKALRKGAAWVIHKEDIQAYKEIYLAETKKSEKEIG